MGGEQSFVEFGETIEKNFVRTKEIGSIKKANSKDKEFEPKQSKCLEQENNYEPRSEGSGLEDDEEEDEFIKQSMRNEIEAGFNINDNDFSGRVIIICRRYHIMKLRMRMRMKMKREKLF